MSSDPRVAVVGAGPAGLMCARLLRDHGVRAQVFDKGRRPGGRTSTREHGERCFDHGAPFFTVRDEALLPWLQRWRAMKVVEPWQGRIMWIDGEQIEAARGGPRYVGVPGMNALSMELARDLEVQCGQRIQRLEQKGDQRWFLHGDDGKEHGPYEAVVLTAPAPQTLALVADSKLLVEKISPVTMLPCVATMLSFANTLDLPFDAAFFRGGPLLWMARNNSKPGRPPQESWVLHADEVWSDKHRELPREELATRLLEDAERQLAPFTTTALAKPTFERSHLWALARAQRPLTDGYLFDPELQLGVAGDWCNGNRVEGACVSGLRLAERLLREL